MMYSDLPASTAAAAPWQQSFSNVLELEWREPDLRQPFGPEPDQFAEVWLSKITKGSAPLIVLIHGGCWLE